MTGNNVALAIVTVALVLLIYFVVTPKSGVLSTPRPRRFGTPNRFRQGPTPDLKDVGQQLYAVMAASFQRRRLLSRSEYDTFKIIEDDIAAARRGYRVFAQTSLGEVLTSPSEDAFRSINSKRVDILIVDQGGWPVVAVEYQGSGHYQGTAAARDAVKKEALRKAGVHYVEVSESDSAEQIRSRVREQLGWKTAALTVGGLRAQRAQGGKAQRLPPAIHTAGKASAGGKGGRSAAFATALRGSSGPSLMCQRELAECAALSAPHASEGWMAQAFGPDFAPSASPHRS